MPKEATPEWILADRFKHRLDRANQQIVFPDLSGVKKAWGDFELHANQIQEFIDKSDYKAANDLLVYVKDYLYIFNSPYVEAYNKISNLGILKPPKQSPSVDEMAVELGKVLKAFPGSRIDLFEAQIKVRTESITLTAYEDGRDISVDLGPFDIVMSLTAYNLGEVGRYMRVHAVEPNYARTTRYHRVTHPNISDGKLCTGEGEAALRDCIARGFFTDAFRIIDSIIHTYGFINPYCKLSAWRSPTCRCCGDSYESDEIFNCPFCECEYCSSCSISCSHNSCEYSSCDSCSRMCTECEYHFCPDHAVSCFDCGNWFCLSHSTRRDDGRYVCQACADPDPEDVGEADSDA